MRVANIVSPATGTERPLMGFSIQTESIFKLFDKIDFTVCVQVRKTESTLENRSVCLESMC